MKKKIYYWSPCLNKVATVKATLNSAISLAKYSNDYDVKIINVFGEWHNYKKNLQDNNVDVLDLSFNYYNFLPKTGYASSRLSYIIIFLISFFPLVTLIKKNKPDYFVAHLITSLPLILINLFNLKIQLNMGIFSYHGIILLHSGQKLLGLIIDMFWGNLCTITFTKLPKINPMNKEIKSNKI